MAENDPKAIPSVPRSADLLAEQLVSLLKTDPTIADRIKQNPDEIKTISQDAMAKIDAVQA
jgi:hypothetical protein